jgi:pyruvate,water dikinase
MLNKTRRGAALREWAKSAAAASVEFLRLVLLEVGQRMASRHQLCEAGDVFHLAGIEVEAYLNGEWSGVGAARLVEDRKRNLERWKLETPGDVLIEKRTQAATHNRVKQADHENARSARTWQGVAAAPGCAEGAACVIDQPHLGDRLAPGDILVAPSTDPAWTPLFLRASAVVMETGGYLSHGAIVAREFGIPSVVNIPGIMTEVITGDRMHIDGDLGEVNLLKDSSQLAPTNNS